MSPVQLRERLAGWIADLGEVECRDHDDVEERDRIVAAMRDVIHEIDREAVRTCG